MLSIIWFIIRSQERALEAWLNNPLQSIVHTRKQSLSMKIIKKNEIVLFTFFVKYLFEVH